MLSRATAIKVCIQSEAAVGSAQRAAETGQRRSEGLLNDCLLRCSSSSLVKAPGQQTADLITARCEVISLLCCFYGGGGGIIFSCLNAETLMSFLQCRLKDKLPEVGLSPSAAGLCEAITNSHEMITTASKRSSFTLQPKVFRRQIGEHQ